jgi:hypothetical protein
VINLISLSIVLGYYRISRPSPSMPLLNGRADAGRLSILAPCLPFLLVIYGISLYINPFTNTHERLSPYKNDVPWAKLTPGPTTELYSSPRHRILPVDTTLSRTRRACPGIPCNKTVVIPPIKLAFVDGILSEWDLNTPNGHLHIDGCESNPIYGKHGS